MAPSIIYFVKEGATFKSPKTGKPTKSKTNHLHVGYSRENYHKVFYEPGTDGDLQDDRNMPANYVWEGGSRYKSDRRKPLEGEITWLIHFDPKNIPNNNKRERDQAHKETLYDAWRYLAEDDPREIKKLERQLLKPDCRRWHSWFEEAMDWKTSYAKRRTKRRSHRATALVANGMTPEEAASKDGLSDTTNDSAVEVDSDNDHGPMGPPPIPPPRATRGSNSNRFPKRRRDQSSSPSSAGGSSGGWSAIGRRSKEPRVTRGRPAGVAGPWREEASDADDDAFMSGGRIEDLPGSMLRMNGPGSVDGLRNGTPSILGRDPSEDFDTRAPEEAMSSRPQVNETEWRDPAEWQNDYGEEDALREALRQSSVAPDLSQSNAATRGSIQVVDTVGEDTPALNEAIRRSLAPPSPPPTNQPTVVDVEGDD